MLSRENMQLMASLKLMASERQSLCSSACLPTTGCKERMPRQGCTLPYLFSCSHPGMAPGRAWASSMGLWPWGQGQHGPWAAESDPQQAGDQWEGTRARPAGLEAAHVTSASLCGCAGGGSPP